MSYAFAHQLKPALALVALLMVGCATSPSQDFSHDGLELRQVRGLDEVWVRPGTDFSAFQTVVVEPVEVAFDPHWDPRRSGTRLRMPQAERERIRSDAAELFNNTFQRELQRSGRFRIVDEAGPDSLVFRPHIIDLFINAPDDRRGATPVRTYVSEFGRVSLIGELVDPESGAIIARISDREIARATRSLEFTDRFTNEREAERIFARWARTLVQQLDALGNG